MPTILYDGDDSTTQQQRQRRSAVNAIRELAPVGNGRAAVMAATVSFA